MAENQFRDAARESNTPGFVGGEGGGEKPSGLDASREADERRAASEAAAHDLNNAEASAAASGEYHNGNGGVVDADARESAPDDVSGGFTRNNNKSGNVGSGKGSNSQLKGKIKKASPFVAIVALFLILAGLFGSQVFQPFSLVAQFLETFNSMHVSANLRSQSFLYYQLNLNRGLTKSPIASAFGEKKFKISEKQASELERQGIRYNDKYEFGDETYRVLEYEDASGKTRIITVDQKLADELNAKGISAATFASAYENDNDFFRRYNAGSMTWRGHIANWFGEMTNKFFADNKLDRNRLNSYEDELKEAGGDAKKATQEILERASSGESQVGGFARTSEDTENADEKGNNKAITEVQETDSLKRGQEYDAIHAKLEKISSKFTGGASIACAGFDFVSAVSLLVAANEIKQILDVTLLNYETVDKVKKGDGNNAPIDVIAGALNVNVEDRNAVVGEEGVTSFDNQEFNFAYKVDDTSGNAMQSEGLRSLYDGHKIDANNASVQSFNIASSLKSIFGGVGVSMEARMGCTAARTAAAAVGLVTDVLGIAGCVLTFWAGGGFCWAEVAKVGLGVLGGVAVGNFLGAIIDAITPMVAGSLTRDLITQMGGINYGNALYMGGSMLLGKAHQFNGGSMATFSKYLGFAKASKSVAMEDARYERETLSPFDITSKNTFLGTFLTSMMGVMSSNKLMSVVTSGNSALTSSILALTPGSYAMNLADSLYTEDEYEEICPYLASINAVGDAFCNPYMITDVDTLDIDPAEVINILDDDGCFEEGETSDGNVIIRDGSRCSKYFTFVTQRMSPFGVVDYSIQSALDGSPDTGNDFINNVIGNLPVIGDGLEIFNSRNTIKNLGFITGESGVAGNDIGNIKSETETDFNLSDSPDWSIAKYYQRFAEDQSLAETTEIITKSAVTLYLEDYYSKNPLDNTYEGQLARYSGLDKETVVDILDVIAYYNYLSNYDPSERYAFGSDVVVDEGDLVYDSERVMDSGMIARNYIIYTDIRNRSFAV